ncbi:hypothetical protein CLF_104818, partial [Clonorchis sinensis]
FTVRSVLANLPNDRIKMCLRRTTDKLNLRKKKSLAGLGLQSCYEYLDFCKADTSGEVGNKSLDLRGNLLRSSEKILAFIAGGFFNSWRNTSTVAPALLRKQRDTMAYQSKYHPTDQTVTVGKGNSMDAKIAKLSVRLDMAIAPPPEDALELLVRRSSLVLDLLGYMTVILEQQKHACGEMPDPMSVYEVWHRTEQALLSELRYLSTPSTFRNLGSCRRLNHPESSSTTSKTGITFGSRFEGGSVHICTRKFLISFRKVAYQLMFIHQFLDGQILKLREYLDRDRWRIIQYGRNTFTIKDSGLFKRHLLHAPALGVRQQCHTPCARGLGQPPFSRTDHWTSSRSISMIDIRKSIPAGNEYDGARKSIKRQLVRSLRKDLKLWWITKAKRSTVKMGLPHATQPVEVVHTGEWNVNLNRPSEEEIQYKMSALKRKEARGPDGLYPVLFKEGGESLVAHLAKLIGAVWNETKIPVEWEMSAVIPVLNKSTRTLCEKPRGISLLAVSSKLPTASTQIIGERNCGSCDHFTTKYSVSESGMEEDIRCGCVKCQLVGCQSFCGKKKARQSYPFGCLVGDDTRNILAQFGKNPSDLHRSSTQHGLVGQ